jgi:hypothetical protein
MLIVMVRRYREPDPFVNGRERPAPRIEITGRESIRIHPAGPRMQREGEPKFVTGALVLLSKDKTRGSPFYEMRKT